MLQAPGAVRYIKLGAEGAFAQACIEAGVLGLSFRNIPHDLCAAGDWDAVRSAFIAAGKSQQKASDHTRELRDFHTLGEDTLWITFADGRLWWAFAALDVTFRDGADLPRQRRTSSPWRSTDLDGRPLLLRELSTRLTSVRGYRSTVCDVGYRDYLLRKIRGEANPLAEEAQAALNAARTVAAKLIVELHDKEFELLIDLIFAQSGWRRVSVLGEIEADVDLIVEEAATGQRAFVQVKSRATPAVFEKYEAKYRSYAGCTRMFFVCHSPSAALSLRPTASDVDLWFVETLAAKTIKAGLLDWLIARVA